MNAQPTNIQRRYDLDWLRVLAILAIFVFHCTRPFDTDDWNIKNLSTYLAIDVWKEFAMTWGMPLILLISGASIFFALGKVSGGKYLKGLCARLLLPLLVGMFTHVAFQIYLENLAKGKFSGSFWQFYPHYFDGMYGFGGNFAWMGLHLWYLEILFILSVLFLPLFLWLKKTRSGQRLLDSLGNFLARPGAVFTLALPAFVLLRTLDEETWGNQDMGGWSVLIYPFFLIAGFLIISNARLQARVRQMRWLSLGLGLVMTPAYLFLEFQTGSTAIFPQVSVIKDLLNCLVSWSWLLVVLGFGMQHLSFNTPFLKYANEAVLPFYILHQTVIVTLGYFVLRWAIPNWLKFLILLLGSFTASIGLYEFLIRRYNPLRFLFGMKLRPRQPRPQVRDTQLKEAI
ncbi:MAG TPA: acyltransferase family protein [Anaerolineales bacterium]|nr:acyltransferase family protein [Anaerolineales bacterium]